MTRWFRDRDPSRGIPAVSLRSLLPDARLIGCLDLVVSGCGDDSRRIEPGEIFAAIRGERLDGHDFARRAIERGACGAIVERPIELDGAVQVIVPDSRAAHARLVQALAGDPASRLKTIVVSGGRARAAAAWGLASILEADGERCGVVAADGAWTDGTRWYPGPGRPPAPAALLGIAETLATRGCRRLVVETTPSLATATDLACLGPIEALIVPDSLPGDDLESRIATRRALKRLALQVRPGGFVAVSSDDPEAELLGAVNLDAERLAFGAGPLADITGNLVIGGLMSPSYLHAPRLGLPIRFCPRGSRNARGAFGAAAAALALGVEPARIAEGLQAVSQVRGRLEPIDLKGPFVVVREELDGESSLRGAFAELRSLGSRRLVCVIAPEAPRRGELARLCGTLSDLVVTGDDRREVIELGLARAAAGDAVLILGGSGRHIESRPAGVHVADDRSIVASWLRRNAGPARRSA